MSVPGKVPLPGSALPPLPGARVCGPVAPETPITVTVQVRPGPAAASLASADSLGMELPGERDLPGPDTVAALGGAAPADLARVTAFARAHGLVIEHADAATRQVVLRGSAAALGAAFGVALETYATPDGPYRGYSGPLHLPPTLCDVVEGIFGLDTRRVARPYDAADTPDG